MTAPVSNVTNKELLIALFVKLLPAAVFVVVFLGAFKNFLIERGVGIPSIIYNAVLIFLLLVALRLTAWSVLRRLAEESKR